MSTILWPQTYHLGVHAISLTAPTVTLSGGSTAFSLISVEGRKSTYRDSSGNIEIVISHQEAKRNRRTVRINTRDITADPFVPAENVAVSYSAYLVVDLPVAGFDNSDVETDVNGLMTWLAASTNFAQILNGES